jgi:hypothetical protein
MSRNTHLVKIRFKPFYFMGKTTIEVGAEYEAEECFDYFRVTLKNKTTRMVEKNHCLIIKTLEK